MGRGMRWQRHRIGTGRVGTGRIGTGSIGPLIGLLTGALLTLGTVAAPTTAQAASCGTGAADTVDLSGPARAVRASVPARLTATDANGKAVILDRRRLERAATVLSVGHTEQVGARAQLVALLAAYTESGLRNLSNAAAFPDTVNAPHDGDGHDHDSVGLFQMRPSAGWGRPSELMDPTWSARAFYGGAAGPHHGKPAGLLDIAGWRSMSLGSAAQAVQYTAYPRRFRVDEPVAVEIARVLLDLPRPQPCQAAGPVGRHRAGPQPTGQRPAGSQPGGFSARFVAAAESQVGLPYVWAGGTYAGPSRIGRDGRGPGFDCSGLVMCAAYRASGGAIRLAHFTGDQVHDGQPIPWTDRRPGDVIFYTRPGQSVPHHVVIYLGGGRIVQAPRTGADVGYGSLADFAGEIATVRRLG